MCPELCLAFLPIYRYLAVWVVDEDHLRLLSLEHHRHALLVVLVLCNMKRRTRTMYRGGNGSDWRVAFSRLPSSWRYRADRRRRENATLQTLPFPSVYVHHLWMSMETVIGLRCWGKKYNKVCLPNHSALCNFHFQQPAAKLRKCDQSAGRAEREEANDKQQEGDD